MGFVMTLSLSTTVRNEATDFTGIPEYQSRNSLPRRSVRKNSWVVRTESNVRRTVKKKPDPSCVVCEGSGRVDCRWCQGKGRNNMLHLEMLPKGEWPNWCKVCGGSGLAYCNRCLGTGKYRDVMGFRLLEKDNNNNESQ